MAFIPTEDCAKAILRWSIGDLEWTNTLWFLKEDFDTADMEQLAGDMLDFAQNELFEWLQNEVDYDGCTIYDMTIENGQTVEGASSAFGGERVGDPAAISAAVVVTFRSPNRGRSGRGRNYVAGLSETDVGDDGVTAVAVQDGIEDAYQALDGITVPHGWKHVVVSLYTDGAARTVGEPQLITSWIVRNAKFGTQRRRIRRP